METADSKPEKVRAFIAIHPDARTLANLQKTQEQLRSTLHEGVRWARPEQLHLTLQFLGYVESTRLEAFRSAIQAVSQRQAPFHLQSQGLGCFPSNKRPRVIWAGLHGDIEQLQQLKSALDLALIPLGYVPETRPFHPHITFGRVTELNRQDAEKLQQFIVQRGSLVFGNWQVTTVDLMRSVLSPKGPTYSVLAAAPLQGPP